MLGASEPVGRFCWRDRGSACAISLIDTESPFVQQALPVVCEAKRPHQRAVSCAADRACRFPGWPRTEMPAASRA